MFIKLDLDNPGPFLLQKSVDIPPKQWYYNINKEIHPRRKGDGKMKKYNVEMRRNYTDNWDNWLGDYIVAESEDEAEELAKQWLIDNGYDGDVDELEYKVLEVGHYDR